MDASDPIKPHKALVPRGPSTYGSRLCGRDDSENAVPAYARTKSAANSFTHHKEFFPETTLQNLP